jgi:hypothetical protein
MSEEKFDSEFELALAALIDDQRVTMPRVDTMTIEVALRRQLKRFVTANDPGGNFERIVKERVDG